MMFQPEIKKYGMMAVMLIVLFVNITNGILCYQCGEYTDGVGSITPCFNYTDEKHLRPCPNENSYCIKYVMEASTVRDCAVDCTEKEERWGTTTYCCKEDACNSAQSVFYETAIYFFCTIYLAGVIMNAVV